MVPPLKKIYDYTELIKWRRGCMVSETTIMHRIETLEGFKIQKTDLLVKRIYLNREALSSVEAYGDHTTAYLRKGSTCSFEPNAGIVRCYREVE